MQPPKPMKPQGAHLRTTDPEVGHETTDISLTGVVAFILTLAFCGIVIFAVLWGVYHFARTYTEKQDRTEMRDPWVLSAETQIEQKTQQVRTSTNKAAEPGSMEKGDAEARVRVSRFPQPRLQTDDVRDLAIMRAAEDIYLNHYVVLDKNSGKVNIPITQAMEALVKKGMPAMQAAPGTQLPPAAEGTGTVRPSIESSHGKQYGSSIMPR